MPSIENEPCVGGGMSPNPALYLLNATTEAQHAQSQANDDLSAAGSTSTGQGSTSMTTTQKNKNKKKTTQTSGAK